jgi:hypothetical protein
MENPGSLAPGAGSPMGCSLTELTDLDILWDFCALAPAKVLFAGTDALLTTSFREGGGGKSLNTEVPGPQPDSNKVLSLAAPHSPCEKEGEGEGGALILPH